MAALVSAVPFSTDADVTMVGLATGEAGVADPLLIWFPRAKLQSLERSEALRDQASVRLARFGDRVRVAAVDVAALDWWDRLFGADLVVSAFCLERLNDAKKRYLYKAVADRLSPRGAFLIADGMASQHPLSRPAGNAHHAALFHHLVWLKHAGFAAVDCVWADEGRAVLAGFKQAGASAAQSPADS